MLYALKYIIFHILIKFVSKNNSIYSLAYDKVLLKFCKAINFWSKLINLVFSLSH